METKILALMLLLFVFGTMLPSNVAVLLDSALQANKVMIVHPVGPLTYINQVKGMMTV